MDTAYRGLPTELLEHILDILSKQQDCVTLKVCSYVNRFFCVLSQTHLLRNVTFNQENNDATVSPHTNAVLPSYNPALHFLDVLDFSPHLVSYIHGLTLTCTWVVTPGPPTAEHWLQNDSGLPRLLPLLVHLRRLSVLGKRFQSPRKLCRPRRWTTFSDGFRTTLVTVLASNILTELDVTGVGLFPFNLFRYCLSLKKLSIATFDVDEPDHQSDSSLNRAKFVMIPNANGPSPSCQLEYLHLEDISDRDDQLTRFLSPTCPLDISHLQVLSVFPESSDEMENIAKFSTFTQNVTDLRIDTDHSQVHTSYNTLSYTLHRHFTPPPDLRGFESLHSLIIDAKFTIRIFHHRILIDYFTSPIPWIIQLLQEASWASPSGPTHLSRLTLNLSFIGFPPDLTKLLHNNWVLLVRCVSKNHFPHFSTLELNIDGLDPVGLAVLRRDEALQELAAEGGLLLNS